MKKIQLSFWQIWNMSFGFFGIQFGWGLQMANMSAIYEKLGAEPDRIPILWLAAPLTGLIIQPIIGALSDRTWTRLGRRRPYFLTGAILASITLFILPNSPSIWMAASMLWILDSSINISMEPFRAFVTDKLPTSQHTIGFVTQSFFIGLGATLANAMPYILRKIGVDGIAANGIPLTVKYSFQIGAFAFLLAVLWTVITSNEYSPEELMEANTQQKSRKVNWVKDIFVSILQMPKTMVRLAIVQFFTWLGLFCMWLFFIPTVARHIFGATDPKSLLYNEGIEWGGNCFAMYSIVCFIVAFLLPKCSALIGRKLVHALSLCCGGISLLSIYWISNQYILLLTMVGVGIAWASILSMPYAILSNVLPKDRVGLYMGIFNFFIVIPEITASLTFQPLVKNIFHNNPLYVVLLGGVCLLIAAVSMLQVQDTEEKIL